MTNLLCLLLGISLPLIAVLLVVRRALRPVAAAAAYRNLAWRLGLDADTRGEALHGTLDGRAVFVGTTATAPGPRVRAMIGFRRPMCMGLSVRPRTMADRLRNRTQRRPLTGPIGERDLDEQLAVAARDPARAATLFDDAVRGALTALRRRWPAVEIDDNGVTVHLTTPPTQQARLEELVTALQALAAALEAARRAVPVDPALEAIAERWITTAETLGLTALPELPTIEGDLAGHAVLVRAVPTDAGPRAYVRLRFVEHPATGLRLRPQHQARPPAGRQDIVVGDPAFDDAFVVQGYDPAGIRGVLHADVRRSLLDLARGRRVHVDDQGVEVFDVDPAHVEAVVAGAVAAAREIRW